MISSKIGEETAEVARTPGEFSGTHWPVAQPREAVRNVRHRHVNKETTTLIEQMIASTCQPTKAASYGCIAHVCYGNNTE